MTLHISEIRSDFITRPVSQAALTKTQNKRTVYSAYFKPALDTILVVLSAPIVLPLILIMAALIALGGGSPFYSQLRIGRGGQHFRIWKMRTMVVDADKKLECYLKQNPEARAEWNSTQKLKNDPRITPLGRLLRRTSIDELPQLWNVFNGTMSLVGPRPMMVEQKADYMGQAYYSMRPGITGLWQVSDRNNCSFADRVFYDEEYYQSLSLKTDAQIILKTVGVVVRATGH